MARRCTAGRALGFTLVEILIAIAILGISMSLVYGVYHSILSVTGQVERTASSLGRNLLVAGQLQRDFFGIYKGRSGYFRAEDPQTLESGVPFLQFTTSGQLRFDEAAAAPALTRVGYFLQKTGKRSTFDLYRIELPFKIMTTEASGSGPAAVLVCADVRELTVRYTDVYGNFFDQWQVRSGTTDSGYDDARFPSLIRIEMVMGEADGDSPKPDSFIASFHVPPAGEVRRSAAEGS